MITPKLEAGPSEIAEAEDQCEGTPHKPENSSNNKNSSNNFWSRLDGNTEVVLRNLVAYEASTVSGPLVLARYTELMNGIIDTKEDVKLLREKRYHLEPFEE
ncbi:hypothetical protein M0R45_031470 [Rubus argutus]|uniref:Uncharacterized protein n=1 Tax=Rubus argutus TaxID=59490 RepID=A0AAW1WG97_RUBAR